jgi:hypothetical protein
METTTLPALISATVNNPSPLQTSEAPKYSCSCVACSCEACVYTNWPLDFILLFQNKANWPAFKPAIAMSNFAAVSTHDASWSAFSLSTASKSFYN